MKREAAALNAKPLFAPRRVAMRIAGCGIVTLAAQGFALHAALSRATLSGAEMLGLVCGVTLPIICGGAWLWRSINAQYIAARASVLNSPTLAGNLSPGDSTGMLLLAEHIAKLGHWRLDLRTDDVFWSPEVYRTHGQRATYVPSLDDAINCYHPDDRTRVLLLVNESIAQGQPFSFEARLVRPDGEIRDVLSAGQLEFAADGTPIALFGIFQDITARKAAERLTQGLNQRMQLATQAGNIGIFEWNLETDQHVWDAAMYRNLGLQENATASQIAALTQALHPADLAQALSDVQAAALGHKEYDTEFRVIWPDQEIHYIRSRATLLRNAAGKAERLIGANWDISEVRNLTARLNDETMRLRKADAVKSEFLARMSHELRTPMNGIIGFTLLALDGQLSSRQRRHLNHLHDAARSLLAIINDILDYSKVQAGELLLEAAPLSISAIVDGVVSILRFEATSKQLELAFTLSTDTPTWVMGDAARLRQVLLNLVTNAAKFTESGSIRIAVHPHAVGENHLYFGVTDTGIGIAEDRQAEIFESFSQGAVSATEQPRGTGIGLALAKRLVHAMHGEIGFTSEIGSGSTFWFSVPLPACAQPEFEPAGFEYATVVPRRILVVEDNVINQVVVQAMLTRDGHEVTLAADGEQAVAIVGERAFDLILMDMEMPVMKGIDATIAIRRLAGPEAHTPIVALTANAMPEDVERCREAGMNAHLAKPITRELLRAAIADWGNHMVSATPGRRGNENGAKRIHGETVYIPLLNDGVESLTELFDGDMKAVCDVLEGAIRSIKIDVARIEEALATDDLEALASAAHRLKGTSGSIHADGLMELGEVVRTAARERPLNLQASVLLQLHAVVSEIDEEIFEFAGRVRA